MDRCIRGDQRVGDSDDCRGGVSRVAIEDIMSPASHLEEEMMPKSV